MTLATRLFRILFLAALGLLLTTPGTISNAQGSITSTREAFITYRCEFEAATNTAKIHAALNDANGLPMPRDRYSVTVTTSNPVQAIPPQRVALTLLARRQPLRMVIVLDTTDTMPIKEIVTAISTQLAPQLDVNDQVAFIRVDSQVSPITPFYIDKNRLINEHMLDLQPGSGDNRVYDGVTTAIDNLRQNRDVRQTLIFITDSGPREGVDQNSAEAIATQARNAKVQIYPIGIHLYDDPSDSDLLTMATTSQGYAWIYDEPNSSNAATGVAVADRLDRLIDVLNSEILISIDLRGQVPDASGLVTFDVVVDMTNGIKLADQIACPIEVLNHSIQFTPGTPPEIITSNPVDLSVTAFSDLSQDDTSIVFRVNDNPEQNSDVSTFTFNTAAFPPGTYNVIAQLRDNNDSILATTERTIVIISQQKLALTESSGSLADLDKPLVLEAISDPGIVLPDALFRINAAGSPELDYPLGEGRATFQGGRATLNIQNLRDEVERLFPEVAQNDVFEIRAYVPSASGANAPVQAESNVRTFTYTPHLTIVPTSPPTTNLSDNGTGGTAPVPTPVNDTSAPIAAMQALVARTNPLILWSFILTVILLLVNIIMMPRVQRQRIRRLVHNPDTREMSNRLMAATVRRDGMKQTLVLTKRTVTLGRGSGNDLNLGDDTNISREHGVIMWRRGKWWYSNRKPRLRARIDGRRYVGFVLYELEPVTEIEVGDAKIFFHSSTQQDVSELTKTNL